ncbi:methyltransferase domain-containing protein [Sphingomonas sp. LB3N6]|uniref:class I SAM-dependent methyltransferase n=1 Tax=Sphingomonas fucosidasi TaxID=3096164 RepID=UPI002FC664CD
MTAFAAALGRQLASPSGLGGRIVGQAMRVANRRPTRLAIDALGVRKGDVALDLGCGTGDAIRALSAAAGCGHVYGLDHSPDMLDAAGRRHPAATVFRASFTEIPLPEASVDRILAANVAYFWHDDRAVLAELMRVLRPSGRLALYVTTAGSLRRIGLGDSGTHRLFDEADLRAMLGPTAMIATVDAGFGVAGLVATLEKPPLMKDRTE